MDFAREHLKQLGWQEGDGLGRGRDGIAEALKPKLKFDNCGIGHDPAKEFTHTWWSEAYNSAAANVTVTEATDGCQLTAVKRGKKKKKKEKKPAKSMYSNFVTGGTLVGDHVSGGGAADGEGTEGEEEAAVESRLSDEQLLAACGGRTAHKGARHGHRMDGKLARIVAQEAAIIARLQGREPAEEAPAKKKKKKRKNEEVEESCPGGLDRSDVDASLLDGVKTKKRKKEKKCDVEPVNNTANDESGAKDALSEKKKKKKRKSQADS